MMLGSMENYRLHSRKDEDEKNLVSKKDVVIGVLLQLFKLLLPPSSLRYGWVKCL
ncbi:UNVERIFIED_CONTAM: Sphinganine C4-monooxygenase 2 [Sesamum latifolium]|uniref:Sphinganine C4-monooxygenase 2 n=1 Tax=Sesamum latifolium TaxID=2727402 RepID=A0AAW2UX96_9LAMI